MRTLIRNGRAALIDRVQDADVLVEDGLISAVGQLGAVTGTGPSTPPAAMCCPA